MPDLCVTQSPHGPNPALMRGGFLYSTLNFESSWTISCACAAGVFALSWIFTRPLLQWIAATFLHFRKCFVGHGHLRSLPGVGLPPADRDIDVKRVQFDGPCPAARLMRGHDGGARPRKRIKHDLAAPRAVLDCVNHKRGR